MFLRILYNAKKYIIIKTVHISCIVFYNKHHEVTKTREREFDKIISINTVGIKFLHAFYTFCLFVYWRDLSQLRHKSHKW